MPRTRVTITALVAAFSLAVAHAAGAQTPVPGAPHWDPPTPADHTSFTIVAGEGIGIAFAASSGVPTDVVQIRSATALPAGAVLTPSDGNPAQASFTWTPGAAQVGTFTLVFVAQSASTPSLQTQLSIVIVVKKPVPPPPPRPIPLTGPGGLSHWAPVARAVSARSLPGGRGKVVGKLTVLTPELEQNLVSLVSMLNDTGGKQWVRVRMPVLPLGTLGWVPRDALGPFHAIRTRVIVNRAGLRLTLYRGGFAIFRAPVGVGKPGTPTPRGEFYVRERLSGYDAPFYGPLAFGTNAISPYLENWPGGGFVGIHGTSLPQLLPGRVSHGCIRMKNPAILKLNKLMPLGTPLTVT